MNLPDTITVRKALGKLWYDKSNNKLKYLNNGGIPPVNGKTPRPVTKHIVENHLL